VLEDINALGKAAENRREILKGVIRTHLNMVLTISTGHAALAEIRKRGQALLAFHFQQLIAMQCSITRRHLLRWGELPTGVLGVPDQRKQ